MLAFEPWIYHYPTVWSWEKYLTSLALNFLIFEVEVIIIALTSQGWCNAIIFFCLWLSNITLYICTPVKVLCSVLGPQQTLHMGWLQPGSIWPHLSVDTPNADWLFPSGKCLISQGTTHCPSFVFSSLTGPSVHSFSIQTLLSSPHSILRWAHPFPWLQMLHICLSLPNVHVHPKPPWSPASFNQWPISYLHLMLKEKPKLNMSKGKKYEFSWKPVSPPVFPS